MQNRFRKVFVIGALVAAFGLGSCNKDCGCPTYGSNETTPAEQPVRKA